MRGESSSVRKGAMVWRGMGDADNVAGEKVGERVMLDAVSRVGSCWSEGEGCVGVARGCW